LYMEGESLSPTRTIMTRAQELEGNFFRSLDINFEWKKESDPEQGWESARKLIDAGIPVLFHADIFYLDHYQSKTHFPLHLILLWGYDPEKSSAYIVDTGWEGLLEIPAASLSQARYSKDTYIHLNGDYFPGRLAGKIDRLQPRVKKAILLQADLLSDPGSGGTAWSGHQGMRKVAERIFEWPLAKDSSWCFRWAYQIIERRGTGGGAFRKLYAGFLKEANQSWPELGKVAPFEKMEIISNKWTELAGLLKEMSEKNPIPRVDLKTASKDFNELADLEQDFFEKAREKLKELPGGEE